MAYEFLRQRAQDQQVFTFDDLGAAAGWRGQTPKTYKSKQWAQLLENVAPNSYRVKSDFLRLTAPQFLSRFSQRRPIYAEYGRRFHAALVTYEFLLPLTREAELRNALDDLFYADSIQRRIQEIGLAALTPFVPQIAGETGLAYADRVTGIIGERFGGYSISHVNGRFRQAPVASRSRAGDMLAMGEKYLLDETTASVRFIVPCQTTRVDLDAGLDAVAELGRSLAETLAIETDDEVNLTRVLFFAFFVEAVVKTVHGEDQIWLLERAAGQERLFIWEANG